MPRRSKPDIEYDFGALDWGVNSHYTDGLRSRDVGGGEFESDRSGIAHAESEYFVSLEAGAPKRVSSEPWMHLYTEPKGAYTPHVISGSERKPMFVLTGVDDACQFTRDKLAQPEDLTQLRPGRNEQAAFLVQEVTTATGRYNQLIIDTKVSEEEWYESANSGNWGDSGHIALDDHLFCLFAWDDVSMRDRFGEHVRRRTTFNFGFEPTVNAKIKFTDACLGVKTDHDSGHFCTALVGPILKVTGTGRKTMVHFSYEGNKGKDKNRKCSIYEFLRFNRYTAPRHDMPIRLNKLTLMKAKDKLGAHCLAAHRRAQEKKYAPGGEGHKRALETETAKVMSKAPRAE